MTFFSLPEPCFFFGVSQYSTVEYQVQHAKAALSCNPWLADPSKPFQQRRIDLGRTLLLDPVAGAIDDPHEPKIGHVLAHDFDEVDAGDEGENRIELARDE